MLFFFFQTRRIDWCNSLLIASQFGYLEVTKVLLKSGASSHLTRQVGCFRFSFSLDDFLNQKNQDGHSPLHAAAYNGHLEICQILFAHGVNVLAKDRVGDTPIEDARKMGFHKIADFLFAATQTLVMGFCLFLCG